MTRKGIDHAIQCCQAQDCSFLACLPALVSNTGLKFDFWFLGELCWGKAMVAYTKPQQRKKEENEGLRGERDQIKFIDLRFDRWQFVGFSELCLEKATVAYAKPNRGRKKN